MKKIIAAVEITRPINLLITFAVVYVAVLICSENFEYSSIVVLAGLSAVLVAAGGNIINDFFDSDIDKINRPDRPIPSGRISKSEALTLYLVTSIIAILISLSISLQAISIIIFTQILLYFYSFSFKAIPLIGNLVVAVCTALAFIYGGIIVGNINAALIPALFAFQINLIREVVKDIEDLEGDEKQSIITFPIKFGLKKTKTVLLSVTLILLITTFYPFLYKLYNIEYFVIVLFLVNLPLIYFIREIYSKDVLVKLSKLSLSLKVVMVLGLVAIYIGRI
jgi:geranylgeranylglycerol-phosphate geranylgeranyltransferase